MGRGAGSENDRRSLHDQSLNWPHSNFMLAPAAPGWFDKGGLPFSCCPIAISSP